MVVASWATHRILDAINDPGHRGEASKPLAMDNFMDLLQKSGYARIQVEINSSKLLKPGVSVSEKKGVFWQSFVYENLPSIYYQCGCLGHTTNG